MKVLLDECIPRKFKASLTNEENQCWTVPEAGFAGKTNGELLALAETSFDIFVTLDKGFAFQQNLAGREIAIILIRTRSARLIDLLPYAPVCLRVIATIKPGEILQVGDSLSAY